MNLDRLRAAIVAANPDILEMKFGCRMRSGTGIYTLVYQSDEGILWGSGTLLIEDNPSLIKNEIIGSPIQLHHVLRAIEKATQFDSGMQRFKAINELLLHQYDDGVHVAEPLWDLTKTFEQQSEPTLRFLEEIICK